MSATDAGGDARDLGDEVGGVAGEVGGGGRSEACGGGKLGAARLRMLDLLLAHEIPIVAEVELPVVHQLLALPGP